MMEERDEGERDSGAEREKRIEKGSGQLFILMGSIYFCCNIAVFFLSLSLFSFFHYHGLFRPSLTV